MDALEELPVRRAITVDPNAALRED